MEGVHYLVSDGASLRGSRRIPHCWCLWVGVEAQKCGLLSLGFSHLTSQLQGTGEHNQVAYGKPARSKEGEGGAGNIPTKLHTPFPCG